MRLLTYATYSVFGRLDCHIHASRPPRSPLSLGYDCNWLLAWPHNGSYASRLHHPQDRRRPCHLYIYRACDGFATYLLARPTILHLCGCHRPRRLLYWSFISFRGRSSNEIAADRASCCGNRIQCCIWGRRCGGITFCCWSDCSGERCTDVAAYCIGIVGGYAGYMAVFAENSQTSTSKLV